MSGSLKIEVTSSPSDDLPNSSIQEAHVVVVSRPDYAYVVHATKDPLTITNPAWHVIIPDVPAPFDRVTQEVYVSGLLKYTDADGNPAAFGWAQELTIE